MVYASHRVSKIKLLPKWPEGVKSGVLQKFTCKQSSDFLRLLYEKMIWGEQRLGEECIIFFGTKSLVDAKFFYDYV